jgi:anti-anti-sigma regulatory factor
VEGLEGYHDVHSYPQARHLPGLVIYRFDAPLFFANAKTFRDEVRRLANTEPKPRWIVIAAEPVTDVDTTASDVLEELDEALNAQGISLVFAELKGPVRAKIERRIPPRDRRPMDHRRPARRRPGDPRPQSRRNRPAARHSHSTARRLGHPKRFRPRYRDPAATYCRCGMRGTQARSSVPSSTALIRVG